MRLKEDPLVLIKQKEQEQRDTVLSNPLLIKKIKDEIAALKKGKKSGSEKESKKDKKSKKKRDKADRKKKDKKHKRHRSRS